MAYKNVKYKEPMFPHQKYEDRLVAFIDVLGFSNMVSATASDEKRLQQLLLGVMEMVEGEENRREMTQEEKWNKDV